MTILTIITDHNDCFSSKSNNYIELIHLKHTSFIVIPLIGYCLLPVLYIFSKVTYENIIIITYYEHKYETWFYILLKSKLRKKFNRRLREARFKKKENYTNVTIHVREGRSAKIK